MPSRGTRADPGRRQVADGADSPTATAGPPVRLHGVVLASMGTDDGLPDGFPEDLELTPYRSIAALTRPAPADQSRKLRDYLLGYAEILNRVARVGPVLPVRFGTTLASVAEVVDQLLAPGHDDLHRRLMALAGRAQYLVRAQYHDSVLIREVLAKWPEAAELHQKLNRRSSGMADPRRVRLGEVVARGVAVQRESDLDLLVREVSPYAVAAAPRPLPATPGDRLADVAFLVDLARGDEFEAAVEDLAERERERVRLRLLGPMAAYDFVADPGEGVATGRGSRWDY